MSLCRALPCDHHNHPDGSLAIIRGVTLGAWQHTDCVFLPLFRCVGFPRPRPHCCPFRVLPEHWASAGHTEKLTSGEVTVTEEEVAGVQPL